MIERDPEKIIMDLLQDEWDGPYDYGFNPSRHISDGWWDESTNDHQITVTHNSSNTETNTGYSSLDAGTGSLMADIDSRIDVNVWVYYSKDEFSSMGPAKDFRWDLESEVRRIIHKHARGTVHNDERELTHLGIESTQRMTDGDSDDSAGVPPIFRSRIRAICGYRQKH